MTRGIEAFYRLWRACPPQPPWLWQSLEPLIVIILLLLFKQSPRHSRKPRGNKLCTKTPHQAVEVCSPCKEGTGKAGKASNEEDDVKQIHDAIEAWRTDETPLIRILSQRNNEQRQTFKMKYKEKYRKVNIPNTILPYVYNPITTQNFNVSYTMRNKHIHPCLYCEVKTSKNIILLKEKLNLAL